MTTTTTRSTTAARAASATRPTSAVDRATTPADAPTAARATPVAAAAASATPGPAPAPAFHGLAYDAFDARAAAEFWAAVLRAEVAPGASALGAELLDGSAAGMPRLVFRQVTEGRELRTPVHLQLTTGDLDGEVRRLQGLGARRLGALTAGGRRSVTLVDPEGNAFDLVAT
ncbi:VOC family protein [Cellulomonas sp. NS3]|uniref:VOC family protein n=1 Tax=Cellulomonas sp. NS3 TaxID=2973977 RepID=UPI002162BA01|nr:VOC family protein [Cellulomonas sp. NS3]